MWMYLELVRDVELMGVEEEEDQVGALCEPAAHVGEVIPVQMGKSWMIPC